MSSLEEPKMSWPVRIGGLSILAVAGAGVGYFVGGRLEIEDLRWDDALAMIIAVLLLAVGVVMAAVVALRPRSVPSGCGVLQAVVMLLAGRSCWPRCGARA